MGWIYIVMRRRQALKVVAACIVICEIFSTFDSSLMTNDAYIPDQVTIKQISQISSNKQNENARHNNFAVFLIKQNSATPPLDL